MSDKLQHFVLLNLDEQVPLPNALLDSLCAYIHAFFGRELKVMDVPVTPIAPDLPQGWPALSARCHQTLESKPGRDGAVAPKQLFGEQLLFCMSLLRDDPVRYGVDVSGAECILGITLNEFYHDPVGLKPEEPVSAEGTKKIFIGSPDQAVGACSVATLEFQEAPLHYTGRREPNRKLPRQIFKLITKSLLALMGLRTCSSQQCIAYLKTVPLEDSPLHLCAQCEETLLRKMEPGSTSSLLQQAARRYDSLAQVLHGVSDRLSKIKLGHRAFKEFEEECDWLQMAQEILDECCNERFRFIGTNGPQCRQRSLRNCLREIHERQPGRRLHRVFSEPLLKRTCLADMAQSAPYRHESGDMHKWTSLVTNKLHKSGGHYAEVGGSLKPKTLGTFVESGLKAALVQKAGVVRTIYGLGKNFSLYKQVLGQMTTSSSWQLVSEALEITSIATNNGTMYGVERHEKKLHKQNISNMRRVSPWLLASECEMISIAIGAGSIYCVSVDGVLHKQGLDGLSINSDWTKAAAGEWLAIAIASNEVIVMDGSRFTGIIYGVGRDNKVYKQALDKMTISSKWMLAAAGDWISIAINAGTILIHAGMIFGVSVDNKVYRQELSKMTPSSSWALVSESMEMIDVTVEQAPDNSKGAQENRFNRLQYFGTDVMRTRTGGSLKPSLLNMEVMPRTRLVQTEEWSPVRARRNAHTLNYTGKCPSLPALGGATA